MMLETIRKMNVRDPPVFGDFIAPLEEWVKSLSVLFFSLRFMGVLKIMARNSPLATGEVISVCHAQLRNVTLPPQAQLPFLPAMETGSCREDRQLILLSSGRI